MSTTIRVAESTQARLAALSRASGRPMTAVVEDALDALERRQFFEAFNNRFAELRSEPETWRSIEAERSVEAALRDHPA